MNRLTSLSVFAALAFGTTTASAAVHEEPTPAEAHVGVAARVQTPIIETAAEADQTDHIIIDGSKADKFGSSWWGGGYNASFQLWNAHNANGDFLVGAGSVRAYGKLFGYEKEMAYLRAGAHNWSGNIVNGEVTVAGQTIKNWYLEEQKLDETYIKSKTFFDASKDFDIYIFTVGVKATASGYVKLDADVSIGNGGMEYKVTPEVKAIATGGSSFSVLGGGVEIEGRLDPLAFASVPSVAYLRISRSRLGCTRLTWGADIDLTVRTMAGKIVVVLDYWVDTWRKTIANWTGWNRTFSLLNLTGSKNYGVCSIIVNPLPDIGTR